MSAPRPPTRPALPALLAFLARARSGVSTEALLLAVAVFVTATANTAFWRDLLDGRPGEAGTWAFAAAVGTMLVALNFTLLAPVATRRTVRPLLALVLVLSAAVDHYATRYGVVIDRTMIRNVLATDTREAAELLNGAFLLHVALFGVLPAALVLRLRPASPGWKAGIGRRAIAIGLAATVGLAALWSVFQDFSSTMRNRHALRYAITPANVAWGLGVVTAGAIGPSARAREPADPAMRRPRDGRRPTLLVLVVGETARAANWQLNGYARPTTPELAAREGLISFGRATACGTSTDVSVPCMFSPFGRADYDEARIRTTDSILQVLARAGIAVQWRDNQMGCKGVCDGLPRVDLSRETVPGLCGDGRCLDEILLHGLDADVDGEVRDRVVVLHQLGNHGPAYHRRYPEAFRRWTPACERDDLRDCSREAVVNAYDNAIAYTDRFLSATIAFLEAREDRYDVALLYVSDHGESLGERGLYLHGMPHAVAPREQLEVPMFWWLPDGSAQRLGVDLACLRERALGPVSHDELYHSVAGLLDVDTPRYRADRDVFAGCRRR